MIDVVVSIVVPCYKQAYFLDNCLTSISEQTNSYWECIIVNDVSSDNTEEIVQLWIKKDSRFRYLKKDNGGLSSARNAGIQIAVGEWILPLDTDGNIVRDYIELASKLFDGIVGDYILWFLNGEKGLYGYLPEYMAVYRIWNGGIWSKKRRATTHFIFANMLTRLSKHSNSAIISSNLRQQSIDTLLRIGFSEMSVKEKINFTYFILRYDKHPLRTLKKNSKKFSRLFRGD